jgi:hypothetical protein
MRNFGGCDGAARDPSDVESASDATGLILDVFDEHRAEQFG